MKKISLLLLLTLFSYNIYSQSENENIIFTKNTDDVRGLKRLKTISANTSILYGGQKKLRKKTKEKLLIEGKSINANVILITTDDFAITPINNVFMEGVAYSSEETTSTPSKNESLLFQNLLIEKYGKEEANKLIEEFCKKLITSKN